MIIFFPFIYLFHGPLRPGSLTTAAATSRALLQATPKSTDPVLKYVHCALDLMACVRVST